MNLEETSLGFYRAWHAALGARHGLLLALRDVALPPETLAHELGLDAPAVADWAEGAWALGLLTRDARGRYRLAPAHRLTLGEPTSPTYMGHHFDYLTTKSLTFAALDQRLRGEPTRIDLADTYAIATRWDHVAGLASLPRAIQQAMQKGIDVLDLGAGHGGWTRAAQERHPASRYSASDLDLTPLRTLQGARILPTHELPHHAYDLVHLGEVLAAAKDPHDVLHTAYRALRPGGRLLLLEGLRPTTRPHTWGQKLILAMTLDFATDGSRYLSQGRLRATLKEAGFAGARLRDLGGSLFMVTARKPLTSKRA